MITPIDIDAPAVPQLAAAAPSFFGYAEGWFLSDYRGQRTVWHPGGFPGTVSLVTLVPSMHLGIVVLTNQESEDAFNAITLHILDSYLHVPPTDWIAAYADAARLKAAKVGDVAPWQHPPEHVKLTLPLAKYAGRYSGARGSFAAGEVLDLSRHAELAGGAGRKASPVVVEAPSGSKTRLPSSNEGLVALHEQGFYEIRPEGAPRGMGQRVAVNLDPAEANLARIDPEELKASVLASNGSQTAGAVAADAPTHEDTERRQTIWWYLLVLAGVLLATETLMSNRLSRRAG